MCSARAASRAVLAVVVVVASVTVGSGLATLNSHPALSGSNWNYAISENQHWRSSMRWAGRTHRHFAPASIPGQLAGRQLANGLAVSSRHNRAMLAWTTAWPW
jgi:hypothetical protein